MPIIEFSLYEICLFHFLSLSARIQIKKNGDSCQITRTLHQQQRNSWCRWSWRSSNTSFVYWCFWLRLATSKHARRFYFPETIRWTRSRSSLRAFLPPCPISAVRDTPRYHCTPAAYRKLSPSKMRFHRFCISWFYNHPCSYTRTEYSCPWSWPKHWKNPQQSSVIVVFQHSRCWYYSSIFLPVKLKRIQWCLLPVSMQKHTRVVETPRPEYNSVEIQIRILHIYKGTQEWESCGVGSVCTECE